MLTKTFGQYGIALAMQKSAIHGEGRLGRRVYMSSSSWWLAFSQDA
jgi:hypothetical protein